MTFDSTREHLGHGLTRRRPELGEVAYPLERTWIYECTLHLATPVDAEAESFSDTRQFVRDTFANAMREAADRMQHGGGARQRANARQESAIEDAFTKAVFLDEPDSTIDTS